MPDEKVFPSQAHTHHHHDVKETHKENLEKRSKEEENADLMEMKRSRKKSFLEFRCRVEDSILSNYLFGKNQGNGHKPKDNLREISLWGVPLLPSKGHPGTDIVLMKFLKAKDFKVNEAFSMLRKTLKWRKEFKIDRILEENLGSDLENVGYVNGTDKSGHPLCYNVFGVFKDREIQRKRFGSKEKRDELLRWRIQFMEKCIRNLEFKPGGANSIVQVIDLKDIPRLAVKEIGRMSKKTTVMFQENYPGLIFRNIIINVPLWFLALHALHIRMLTQKAKHKFIFVRSAKVTETLLKFIAPEYMPVQYGGLNKENDEQFSPLDKVLEQNIKGNATDQHIEIPVAEGGMTIFWDMTVAGYEVTYKEEFVPDDDCSYKVLLQKGKKMGKSVSNSFHISEPGKIVITFENGTYKKRRVFYRYRIKPTVPMYIYLK